MSEHGVRLLTALLLGLAVVSLGMPATSAQEKETKKTLAQKLAKLNEPWPDAEGMSRRRMEAEQRRLFATTDPLTFTLTADFDALNKDRTVDSAKRFPGVLTVAGADGKTDTIPVKLGTRGNFRLMKRNCSFVPIRIEFPEDKVQGTVFEAQDSLKLGTHCQNAKEYEQYTMREYLTYRIFNLFTPRSFRARLAKGTYVDSVSGKTVAAKYALFIESDNDVARRMEGREAALPNALFKDLDSDTLTQMMLFEYMIGNTDYSIVRLHNVRLIKGPARSILYPVPYDWDISGLVNPPYAIPDRRLPIKTVLERMYRGPCQTAEQWEPLLLKFRAKKAEVLALFDSIPDLEQGNRRQSKAYLEEFFSTISKPSSFKHDLVDCKPQPTM